MLKSTIPKPTTKFGNDASRRLYRGAAEAARKLEQRLSMGSSLTELFSSEVTELRMRLKDYCERLIFTDPVEYGKKAEDLLWRKVFYDFFCRCKQNRKKFFESEYHRSALLSHLFAGIGFYHHLLLRIQTEFHINLEGKVDAPLLWQMKGVKKERWKKYQLSAASDENVKSWADQSSHRILIYLGDLERYISELEEPESVHLAERYYQQALCINSVNGTPHNQLGSLYCNKFDAAYHYMRCLACKEKFDGAEGNLQRVFEKNEEVIHELYSSDVVNTDDNESLKRSRFLSRFLKLCQIFYFKPPENYSCEMYCEDILKEFDITQNGNTFDGASVVQCAEDFLPDELTFKVVVMSLMCVWKLQEKGNSDSSVATAFCLALFSYVVQGATRRLLSSILDLKPADQVLHNGCVVENEKNLSKEFVPSKDRLSSASEEVDDNRDLLAKKMSARRGFKKFSTRRMHRFRRRRKMSSTSQEDSELSEGEMTDLPESDEESGVLNSDLSQAGSCSSDTLSEDDDVLLEESLLGNEGETYGHLENGCILTNGTDDVSNRAESKEAQPPVDNERSLWDVDSILDDTETLPEKYEQILEKNGLLPCLKILTDWLRLNEDILAACAESSQILLSCLIQLLNILLKIEEKLKNNNEELERVSESDEKWVQSYPLPEDTALQFFPLLKGVHSKLPFDVPSRRTLSPASEVYLRVKCLLSFGKCLIKASESAVDYDADKKKYYFNLCHKAKESHKEEMTTAKAPQQSTESQRLHLMQSMAHLWLKAEVNTLEKIVEGGSAVHLSPYLVADASVLCSNLLSVKQLVNSKRFIIVVPLVVIASLDYLKKESLGAREAIRWLEFELRKGCRYIRAQRQIEKSSLVPMKYPRKKDKDAWDFFQILECCNYLVQQQTNGKPDCHLVTLLVGSFHHLPDNAVPVANSIDVTIEKLGSFLSKWRCSLKKPG